MAACTTHTRYCSTVRPTCSSSSRQAAAAAAAVKEQQPPSSSYQAAATAVSTAITAVSSLRQPSTGTAPPVPPRLSSSSTMNARHTHFVPCLSVPAALLLYPANVHVNVSTHLTCHTPTPHTHPPAVHHSCTRASPQVQRQQQHQNWCGHQPCHDPCSEAVPTAAAADVTTAAAAVLGVSVRQSMPNTPTQPIALLSDVPSTQLHPVTCSRSSKPSLGTTPHHTHNSPAEPLPPTKKPHQYSCPPSLLHVCCHSRLLTHTDTPPPHTHTHIHPAHTHINTPHTHTNPTHTHQNPPAVVPQSV